MGDVSVLQTSDEEKSSYMPNRSSIVPLCFMLEQTAVDPHTAVLPRSNLLQHKCVGPIRYTDS